MRRCLLWLAPLLALAACNPASPDGYTFEQAEYVQTEFQVKVVPVQSRGELMKLIPATDKMLVDRVNGTGAKPELMAFGRLSADRKTCTIYFVAPPAAYEPQWMGHELAHCIYGRWHPTQTADRTNNLTISSLRGGNKL